MTGDVGKRVVSVLVSALDDSPMSQRDLAKASGVKLTRLGDVLRRGRAITVSELDAIADALGMEGWRVMRQAEESLAPLEVWGAQAPDPAQYITTAQAGDVPGEQEESQDQP